MQSAFIILLNVCQSICLPISTVDNLAPSCICTYPLGELRTWGLSRVVHKRVVICWNGQSRLKTLRIAGKRIFGCLHVEIYTGKVIRLHHSIFWTMSQITFVARKCGKWDPNTASWPDICHFKDIQDLFQSPLISSPLPLHTSPLCNLASCGCNRKSVTYNKFVNLWINLGIPLRTSRLRSGLWREGRVSWRLRS